MINMTRVYVIFCIVVYASFLHGDSLASIYEVLGKNLSSQLKEGLENAGSTTRQSGTDKGWHKGDGYFIQHMDSSQRDKQSKNKNDYNMYSTEDGRRLSSSSSSSYGEEPWD